MNKTSWINKQEEIARTETKSIGKRNTNAWEAIKYNKYQTEECQLGVKEFLNTSTWRKRAHDENWIVREWIFEQGTG